MSKKRSVLLIEPKYKNKYPPIGLMKIASYHKMLGDEVTFFKGDLKDLVLDRMTDDLLAKLSKVDSDVDWTQSRSHLRDYIKTRKTALLEILPLQGSRYESLLRSSILAFSDIYKKRDYRYFPKWDRIYVTTLFTFYWKVTVEAIQYSKNLVSDPAQIFVGGVLASLLPKELEETTGITPHKGLLDKPGVLDPGLEAASNLIVDEMPLDYSILDEIDYIYPTGSAYFTFMTKGCTRKCAFCSVPILEPTYKPKVDTVDKFSEVTEVYGEQQHLLLMDNNVLASPKFPEIVQEIKAMGFYPGATYIEPNQLAIAVRNLKSGLNDKAYVKKSHKLLNELLRRLKGVRQQNFYNKLVEYDLIRLDNATKSNIIAAYEVLGETYERYRSKIPKQRYVDFNQGTDARYVTDELMKLMSEIPIRPLRIAFDYWGMRSQYENAVRLAAKYGISELSNYILYNFKDTPEELYRRLEINVLLNEELDIHIYSFPMKYIPLFGEEAKDRNFIGSKWNRKFIRAVQSILNVTKGIVAPGRAFFEEAFGRNFEEFSELLYMPENYIVYRHFFRDLGFTQLWLDQFRSLTEIEKAVVIPIIESNNFSSRGSEGFNDRIQSLLEHYDVRKEAVDKIKDLGYERTKNYFNTLVKRDQFKNLTLTYDFEAETIK